MSRNTKALFPRRVYPLSPRDLSEEQLAVAFAMTSRRPEPFDEIAEKVTQEKAADFHERWVLGYGHASVAEHAIIHLAVENLSRLACDALEDNRLASYTEKSSRYQILSSGYYHIPRELENDSTLDKVYRGVCDKLFNTYEEMLNGVQDHLRVVRPQNENERESAYGLRLRREATDSCRFMLPAATLTNVGVTINARSLEHAITKLLSSNLVEERELGEELKTNGRETTPTLIKYADFNQYISSVQDRQREHAIPRTEGETSGDVAARLVHYDIEAELKLVAALIYKYSGIPYEESWRQAKEMLPDARAEVISSCLQDLGPHDSPVRELELVDYTFELVMDYGAYREFKRHRMQSYIPQPLTVAHGWIVPPLIQEAGLEPQFNRSIRDAEEGFYRLYETMPHIAPYLATHAHNRRILTKVNLRECYHLFKLRTHSQAHFSIRWVMEKALRVVMELHPQLFRHIPLRDFPEWWPDLSKVE